MSDAEYFVVEVESDEPRVEQPRLETLRASSGRALAATGQSKEYNARRAHASVPNQDSDRGNLISHIIGSEAMTDFYPFIYSLSLKALREFYEKLVLKEPATIYPGLLLFKTKELITVDYTDISPPQKISIPSGSTLAYYNNDVESESPPAHFINCTFTDILVLRRYVAFPALNGNSKQPMKFSKVPVTCSQVILHPRKEWTMKDMQTFLFPLECMIDTIAKREKYPDAGNINQYSTTRMRDVRNNVFYPSTSGDLFHFNMLNFVRKIVGYNDVSKCPNEAGCYVLHHDGHILGDLILALQAKAGDKDEYFFFEPFVVNYCSLFEKDYGSASRKEKLRKHYRMLYSSSLLQELIQIFPERMILVDSLYRNNLKDIRHLYLLFSAASCPESSSRTYIGVRKGVFKECRELGRALDAPPHEHEHLNLLQKLWFTQLNYLPPWEGQHSREADVISPYLNCNNRGFEGVVDAIIYFSRQALVSIAKERLRRFDDNKLERRIELLGLGIICSRLANNKYAIHLVQQALSGFALKEDVRFYVKAKLFNFILLSQLGEIEQLKYELATVGCECLFAEAIEEARGDIYLERKEFQKAAECFKKVCRPYESGIVFANRWFKLAQCLHELNYSPDEIEYILSHCKEAIKLNLDLKKDYMQQFLLKVEMLHVKLKPRHH